MKYTDLSSAGQTLAADALWEKHSWLLLFLLSSWLFVLHECPEAPAEKECHCTKHCINIVRGSFAMNNLCLMELRNAKTERRNSSSEWWDWVLNAWFCFPVPLIVQGQLFQDEATLGSETYLCNLAPCCHYIRFFSVLSANKSEPCKKNKNIMVVTVWTSLKLLVICHCSPYLIKFGCLLMVYFLLPFCTSISLCFLEALHCSLPWDCFFCTFVK